MKSNDLGLNFQRLDQAELNGVRDDITPLRQLERERAKLDGLSAKANIGVGADAAFTKGERAAKASSVAGEPRGSLRVPGRDPVANAERDRTNNGLGESDPAKIEDRVRKKAENSSAQVRTVRRKQPTEKRRTQMQGTAAANNQT